MRLSDSSTRSTHYREQAVRLRDLVQDLPVGRLSEQLLSVAVEYDELADSIDHRNP
jgi:hypothetical protein